jgi:hypothetical protein
LVRFFPVGSGCSFLLMILILLGGACAKKLLPLHEIPSGD